MQINRLFPASAIALVALAACESPYTVSASRCSPSQHRELVGTNIGDMVLPPSVNQRVISPGMQIGNEMYNPTRLNIFVDEKGWIARVRCG